MGIPDDQDVACEGRFLRTIAYESVAQAAISAPSASKASEGWSNRSASEESTSEVVHCPPMRRAKRISADEASSMGSDQSASRLLVAGFGWTIHWGRLRVVKRTRIVAITRVLLVA